MAYRIPTFNLVCRLWSSLTGPPNPPRLVGVPCQLRCPNHIYTGTSSAQPFVAFWELCVAKLTDIRDYSTVTNADLVEVPSGSGRFYAVRHVDDVAKGFANEYRVAYLHKQGAWPTPIT